jgi:hypothetical protein
MLIPDMFDQEGNEEGRPLVQESIAKIDSLMNQMGTVN